MPPATISARTNAALASVLARRTRAAMDHTGLRVETLKRYVAWASLKKTQFFYSAQALAVAGKGVRMSSVSALRNSARNAAVTAAMRMAPRAGAAASLRVAPALWSRSFASGGFLPKDEVSERVMDVVKNFQNVDPAKVVATSHFINDLGLDSLDTVEVCASAPRRRPHASRAHPCSSLHGLFCAPVLFAAEAHRCRCVGLVGSMVHPAYFLTSFDANLVGGVRA